MVGYGGGVSANNTPIGDTTQGCLAPVTSVPWPVYALLILVTLGSLSMFLYYLGLLISIFLLRGEKMRDNFGTQHRVPPVGLLGWMVWATKNEGSATTEVGSKHLKAWSLSSEGNGHLEVKLNG